MEMLWGAVASDVRTLAATLIAVINSLSGGGDAVQGGQPAVLAAQRDAQAIPRNACSACVPYGPEQIIYLKFCNICTPLGTMSDATIRPNRWRSWLKADMKGQFHIVVGGGLRLYFEPDHSPLPTVNDGGLDRKKVTAIKILEVDDKH